MKIRTKIFIGIFIFFIGVSLHFIIPMFDWESSTGACSLETPEWLKLDIDTAAQIQNAGAGPTILNEQDTYEIMILNFYDGASGEQIKDPVVLEEILNMFEYTEDSFVYSKERTIGGACFFYYDGIFPAQKEASLFQGFYGKKDFEIERISVKVHSYAFQAEDFNSLEEVLEEFARGK